MGNLDLSHEILLNTLRETMAANAEIFGMAVAFEPYAFEAASRDFAPYIARKEQAFEISYLGGADYRYVYHDWYQIPRETRGACWSEPYFDEGGGDILMATFSVPFFREGGERFAGVITADISLKWLDETISAIRIHETGYGFILSRNGTFVTHPEKRWAMNETIFSIAEAWKDTTLRKIGRQMIQGKSGWVPFTGYQGGKSGFLYFAPICSSGWSLGIFFPGDELMADLNEFNRTVLFLGGVGMLLLFLVVWLVSRTITRPLTALSGAAREMATGNLEVEVPSLGTGGEVGILANSFEHLRDSLKVRIRELLETTAAKERIESELSIAREIQMGLLPKIFPPFPEAPEFDLYALIKPAREVGGDLYDFYRVGDERICFVVGDVSGKGVPASLFMAVTMTLIKMTAAKGLSPDRILREVNVQLSRDNDSCMFVTLFCGILDTRTGALQYANGGHNPPVLMRTSGEALFLEGTDGILLGVSEEFQYEMKQVMLEPGDGLLLYSDGVTEAMDEGNALYSEERLIALLTGMGNQSTAATVDGVMQSVLSFAGSAPQADDITLMMVRYCARGKVGMEGLPRGVSSLRAADADVSKGSLSFDTGRKIRKRLPRPGLLSTATAPW
jgi:sigma-B regulation protein RsbU (phosphoserine phosphatase)